MVPDFAMHITAVCLQWLMLLEVLVRELRLELLSGLQGRPGHERHVGHDAPHVGDDVCVFLVDDDWWGRRRV